MHPVLRGDGALSVPAAELEQRRGPSVTWRPLGSRVSGTDTKAKFCPQTLLRH